jgi:hypothetical protein
MKSSEIRHCNGVTGSGDAEPKLLKAQDVTKCNGCVTVKNVMFTGL